MGVFKGLGERLVRSFQLRLVDVETDDAMVRSSYSYPPFFAQALSKPIAIGIADFEPADIRAVGHRIDFEMSRRLERRE